MTNQYLVDNKTQIISLGKVNKCEKTSLLNLLFQSNPGENSGVICSYAPGQGWEGGTNFTIFYQEFLERACTTAKVWTESLVFEPLSKISQDEMTFCRAWAYAEREISFIVIYIV